ncbi:uncharacterized protein PRCAT00004511001 [Priceomyces carsonii]|uniref:uncharacterized protein n=1 Tax=Priceomyces carsonii TaxID=28549 RepID=UPI002EDA868A|nr:unnamed protein product [Priceomyces carsonii]
MAYQDLPSRQKSQRLINKMRLNRNRFQQFRQKAKNINNINELLPGLNDISDAFEALPQDLIKYFTLLKEIDAKCINTFPRINSLISKYIANLHSTNEDPDSVKVDNLSRMKNKINEIIPCLEEKMHVTSVASDLMSKHLFRINNDYKLIVQNNEIPESIRIGPLNHPAMIMDSSSPSDVANPNRSAQSQRSESRREALAARKANKESDDTDKRKKVKDPTPENKSSSQSNTGKKRSRKDTEEVSRSGTPVGQPSKKRTNKIRTDEGSSNTAHQNSNKNTLGSSNSNSNEPTYCYCNQVSFGEMVGCDGDDCKREWFHLPCIGFKNPPKGKWYCDDCLVKMKTLKKI